MRWKSTFLSRLRVLCNSILVDGHTCVKQTPFFSTIFATVPCLRCRSTKENKRTIIFRSSGCELASSRNYRETRNKRNRPLSERDITVVDLPGAVFRNFRSTHSFGPFVSSFPRHWFQIKINSLRFVSTIPSVYLRYSWYGIQGSTWTLKETFFSPRRPCVT